MGLVAKVKDWIGYSDIPSSASPTPGTTGTTGVSNTTPAGIQRRASSNHPYEGASTSHRGSTWNTTRLGPTTLLWGNLEILRSRCRDEVRNNPLGRSACDNFESQVIGRGIRPRWNVESEETKAYLEKEWDKWALSTAIDAHGQSNFYGLQALAARELFESGEVFVRFLVKPSSWKKTKVPLVVKLMEGEQLPVFHNVAPATADTPGGLPKGNSIRTGKEFNEAQECTAYWFYKEHPGETMFFPLSGLTYMRVPADDILHVFKPLRAGQLRGVPFLSAVITLLYEIGKYSDAAVVKKVVSTMFAGFIKKTDPAADLLPPNPDDAGNATGSSSPDLPDPGTREAVIEAGTLQELNVGEDIVFPSLPQDNDIQHFFSVFLHQFAVGIGATYEQITGDLRGVNLSSIRAGILDVRRKCEQLQLFVFVAQFILPLVKRWVFEGVMSGALTLPDYIADPSKYEDISFALPGWPWLDPLKDAQANELNVKAGFDSREDIVGESGKDAATIDAQQERDNARAKSHGLNYTTRTDLDPAIVAGGSPPSPGGKKKVGGEDSEGEEEAPVTEKDSTE